MNLMHHVVNSREMITLIRCLTVLVIVFWGDPNLMSAIIRVIELFGR